MVFSIALRILGDGSAAEEAAQDVFLELHGKLRRVRLGRARPLLAAPGRRASLPSMRVRSPGNAGLRCRSDWNELPESPICSSGNQRATHCSAVGCSDLWAAFWLWRNRSRLCITRRI